MVDGGFLDKALGSARARAGRAESLTPRSDLEMRCADRAAPPSFAAALRRGEGEGIRIIAEIKPASPSAGTLGGDLSIEEMARAYARGGAAAVSVLTEPEFFSGELEHLERAGNATSLPLLCKDFIVSPYQVLQARSRGASSLLLLVAALEDAELRSLIALCRELAMEPLVEVRDQAELERALDSDARVLGINNRDLRTLKVDLENTLRLRELIPAGPVVVGASGYRRRPEAARAERAGVDALLVGESLMRSSDPVLTLLALRGVTAPPVVKPAVRVGDA